MLRYAIIGFGGLGKIHLLDLLRLEKERGDIVLCGICGADKESLTKKVTLNLGAVDVSSVDFSKCIFYDDYKALIKKERPDFIVSSLPTYLHEEISVYALSNGIHVFSEKPMALSSESCENMIAAMEKADRKLMIGQSMRFNPQFSKLKEYIDKKTFGEAYRFEISRYSQTPLWSWNNWILDVNKSGGCILDMHIHDVDLINWLFGKPDAVYSIGTEKKMKRESVISHYQYDDKVVTANADWSMTQRYPFSWRCLTNFENATLVLSNVEFMVYTDKQEFSPEVSTETSHYLEMKSFVEMLIDEKANEQITNPYSVKDSVEIALAEIKSIESGDKIFL